MNIQAEVLVVIEKAIKSVFDCEIDDKHLTLQPTRKDFDGDFTFVCFPLTKQARKKPEDIGKDIGEYLKANTSIITDYNVVKGFLNLSINKSIWLDLFTEAFAKADFGRQPSNGKKIMIEYSSPNTNKPLHLGHLRNNFLGHAISLIFEENGYDVQKVNLINDRGIHICKSMLAYQKFGAGEIPTAERKGDKLVGDYYVKFDQEYKKEIAALTEKLLAEDSALTEEQAKEKAKNEAPLLLEAQAMLRKWEAGDEETVALWKQMNNWVYAGFDVTYKSMGVSFDKMYYESETYLLGKDIVEEGLEKGVFFKKDNGSVWINLEDEGLDEKLVLRGDGTSVYMTQDMGTADLKFKEFPMDLSVYVVGNEQEYHFKVLQLIMKKMGRSYAPGIFHLSYGMVDLPSGKMKSREGTVVDADDLIAGMIDTARERTEALGKIDGFTTEEAQTLYSNLALGALKYYLLKVDAKKRILFNPEESIDFQGNTGVYIQYNYAKINAILRKAAELKIAFNPENITALGDIHELESELITSILRFPEKIQEAAKDYSPSAIANYVYDLSKLYSRFYAELQIFGEEDEAKKAFRIALSEMVARIIKRGMGLLGVAVPDRM